MTALHGWLRRQSERERNGVVLQDALLSNQFWGYAWYRLRFFILRLSVDCVLHAIRFLLLYHIFFWNEFIALLLLQVGAGLVTSFWWGALEVLRTRVRHLHRSGRPYLIPKEIGRWLSLSFQLATMAVVMAVAWTAWEIWFSERPYSPADLYVLAIFLRLAQNMVTRCYHSGIYAIRRIYRPARSLVAAQVLSVVAALGLWPWIGSWSVPIAELAAGVVGATLTLHYTRRLYRFFAFAPGQFVRLARLRLPFRDAGYDVLAGGLSYAVMHLDSLLVLALVGASAGQATSTTLFVLFFLVGPLIRAGFDWAQLFYFDLKRLELKPFRHLRMRFEQGVFRLALLLGAIFWVLTSLAGTILVQRSLGDAYWLLGPFFVARSLLASVQIQTFTQRAYGDLLRSTGVLLTGMLAMGLLGDEHQQILLLSIVMFAVFAMLRRRQPAIERATASREVEPALHWIVQVRGVTEPVRICAARLHPEAHAASPQNDELWGDEQQRKHLRLAQRIAARLNGRGSVALMGRGVIVWYEEGDPAGLVDEEWLLHQGGGLVKAIERTSVHHDGLAAIDAACRASMFGHDLQETWRDGQVRARVATIAELYEAFARMFPNGVIYDPHKELPPALRALPSKERRSIIFNAAAFARDYSPRSRQSAYEVSALVVGGELRLIFAVDRRVNRRLRSRWTTFIRRLNMQVAMNAVVVRDVAPGAAPVGRPLTV